MELRQIRHFLAICEYGGFSRAAEACGVTQPALTKAIKALEEEEVGGSMFHREGRRLVLSEQLVRQAPLRVGVGGLLSRPLVEPSLTRRVQAIDVRGRHRMPAVALFPHHMARFGWPG